MMADMEEISKPKRPPPIMEMAAIKYTLPIFFTILTDFLARRMGKVKRFK